jgi:formylglycine-generating enzyme
MKTGHRIAIWGLAAFSLIAMLGFSSNESLLPRDLDDPVNIASGKLIIASKESAEPTAVKVEGFNIDRYEVTNFQYEKFIQATGRKVPLSWVNSGYSQDKAALPVTAVTWDDAQSYCQWANKRLPTAEEWMLAAGAARNRTYPWGEEIASDYAYVGAPMSRMPMPVGSFKHDRSPYGVMDMAGNVSEWTSSSSQLQELGWYRDKYKVVLGGSYRKPTESARIDNQQYLMPITRNDDLGFRCAW